MEVTINGLIGRHLGATDGKIGKVDEFYFDDYSWKIHYMVVNMRNWLTRRKILFSTDILVRGHRASGPFPLNLTKKQIRNTPEIDERMIYGPGINDIGKVNDPYLRSTMGVIGYHIHARDGNMGTISDFVLDDQTWQITYLVLDAFNWLGGKKMLLDVRRVNEIQWGNSKILTDATIDTIINSSAVRRRIESARGRMDLLYLL